ncbi:MAG TPA: hypothetical protein VF950_11645 [Planctomycetota bacterium]
MKTGLALAIAFSAAGCSSLALSEGPVDPGADLSKGEIQIRVPRKGSDDQARGYTILLTAPDGSLVAHVASGGGPWAFEDLRPGVYDVRFAGSKIRPFSFDVRVKEGRRTTATFHAWRARASGAAEDLAAVTGKTILYTVVGVIYIPWLVFDAAMSDDEDQDVQVEIQASNDKSRRRDKPPDPEPRNESTPRPRVRSLLKEP